MSQALFTASFFHMPSGKLAVLCRGRFRHRALPLTATIGRVRVSGISIAVDESFFIGVLPATPNAGDELVVRYLPEPPTKTGVRFPALAVS